MRTPWPQDEGVDARMLSALIAGVRRAFPYVAAEAVEPLIEEHSAALFRVCHTASFGVAVQGLMLLFQLMAAQHSVSDRFYRWGVQLLWLLARALGANNFAADG